MIVVASIILWYFLGVFGSMIMMEFYFRRGSTPYDIDVGDIIFGLVMAVCGPIQLLVGFFFFLGWVFRKTIDTERVVFKRKV